MPIKQMIITHNVKKKSSRRDTRTDKIYENKTKDVCSSRQMEKIPKGMFNILFKNYEYDL